MKKLLFLSTLFLMQNIYSQGFSIDIGGGISIPGGDAYEETKTGLDLKLIQLNYKFNESFGITSSFASSAHGIEDSDANVGLGRLSIGPSYTLPLGGVSWEFKPQFILSSAGVVDDPDFGDSDIDKANGFVIGNSILFGTNEGFQFLANIDFITGKLKEIEGIEFDEENGYSFFNIGIGVRYNF